MKAIRITFQTVGNDGQPDIQREYMVSREELMHAAIPVLPLAAKREAEKFWEVVVGMGMGPEPPK